MKTATVVNYIPALVCAVISVALVRGGFPVFLFLVPFGFATYGYKPKIGWLCASAAIVINAVFLLLVSGINNLVIIDIIYFTLMVLVFTWIVAPPFEQLGRIKLTLAYRLIAGSVIGLLIVGLIILANFESFYTFFLSQGEALIAVYMSSLGGDVVRQYVLEEYMTPENVVNMIAYILLRGGALFSSIVIFFMGHQLSLLFARIIRKRDIRENAKLFYVHSKLIWVLSFSISGVLLGRLLSADILDITAWNIIIVCAILYLAQGVGIFHHLLERWKLSPFMRLLLSILIIVLILSPASVILLGLLIFLGIAEHWVPFRAPKNDGPSSTPEA